MIRPFDLRDVPLVAQLENQGTLLNAELALTQRPRPLQTALASLFPLHAQTTRTYVRRGALPAGSDPRRGVAQLQLRRDATRGYLTFVAPILSTSEVASDTWVELLEYVGLAHRRRHRQRRRSAGAWATSAPFIPEWPRPQR